MPHESPRPLKQPSSGSFDFIWLNQLFPALNSHPLILGVHCKNIAIGDQRGFIFRFSCIFNSSFIKRTLIRNPLWLHASQSVSLAYWGILRDVGFRRKRPQIGLQIRLGLPMVQGTFQNQPAAIFTNYQVRDPQNAGNTWAKMLLYIFLLVIEKKVANTILWN